MFAVSIVASSEALSVDGEKVVSFEVGMPHGRSEVGNPWQAFDNLLRTEAADVRKQDARHLTQRAGLWMLQCDSSVPYSLLHDVMESASAAGFTRPQLIVMAATANPLLAFTTIRAIPIRHVAASDGSSYDDLPQIQDSTPVVAIRANGFELLAPRRTSIPQNDPEIHPYAELTSVIAPIRADTGISQSIVIAPDPAVRFVTVVATLDAVRERDCDQPGGCEELFPDVWLAGGRQGTNLPR